MFNVRAAEPVPAAARAASPPPPPAPRPTGRSKRAQRDNQARRIKFSPSKSSPATLIREFRKVRSRKNWLQRELYNAEQEKVPSEAPKRSSGPRQGKRKLSETEGDAGGRQKKRVRKNLKLFNDFEEKHVHAHDKVEFVNSMLMQLTPTERAKLRSKTVMQQEGYIHVRKSFKELEASRLNCDFAIDLEYNCLVSDRIRRFIRRRGSMSYRGRWRPTTHLPVPEPASHSKSMGIKRALPWPSLLPPEGKTLAHKKWLRNGFGLILSKQGVGTHLHPLKLAAHVLAEARLAGRLKPLERCRTRHSVQLLNDAVPSQSLVASQGTSFEPCQ